ncbi:MAG: nitroreductase family protein [Clostridiales Family XIII bacterium]|jgi:nitroreductase|nr:nitroreductase family protein [Clostridiales Family XIII bacterium]
MELMEIIQKRRSVRRFKSDEVKSADIIEMVEAARLAPSGSNLQNWHFTAFKQKNSIKRIADAAIDAMEEIAGNLDAVNKTLADKFRRFSKVYTFFFAEAPALIVVMSKASALTGFKEMEEAGLDASRLYIKSPGMQSLGAAVENLLLRAFDLGYGGCWITSANYADTRIEKILREETGFDKPDYYMAALIAIGVPDDDAKPFKKKQIEDILTIVE